MQLVGLVSIFSIAVSAFLWARLWRLSDPATTILAGLICGAAQIVVLAHLLSFVGSLNSLAAWCGGSFVVLALASASSALMRRRLRSIIDRSSSTSACALPSAKIVPQTGPVVSGGTSDRAVRLRLGVLVCAVLICGLLNLIVVFTCAPGTWDSMSYHLARVAFYLQQGSFDVFEADYWAQVVHPTNGTALLLYTLLVTGSENLTQGVQLTAYWATLLAVYGLSVSLGVTRRAALFAALVFGLLTAALMEATTAQNDLLVAAFVAGSACFLHSSIVLSRPERLLLAGLGLGLALGTKASVLLVLPSLGIVAVHAFCLRRRRAVDEQPPQETRSDAPTGPIGRTTYTACIGAVLVVFVLTMPSGYWRNLQLIGHPVAPKSVREEHTFTSRSLREVARAGTLNALRYTAEFLSLDGLPAASGAAAVQSKLQSFFKGACELVGCDLEIREGTRELFSFSSPPSAHEDRAYWGILGPGLVLPISLLVLLGGARPFRGRLLVLAGALFCLLQAYAGPYDPWRGRYFILMAIFLTPLAGHWLDHFRHRLFNGYAVAIVTIAALSGLCAITFHDSRPLLPATRSVLAMTRMEQLCVNRPKYLGAFETFDRIVPRDAVVAISLEPNSYEYPLFGSDLSRRIVPLNSFRGEPRDLPSDAEYLLYDHRRSRPSVYHNPDHLRLGKDWYLAVLERGKTIGR